MDLAAECQHSPRIPGSRYSGLPRIFGAKLRESYAQYLLRSPLPTSVRKNGELQEIFTKMDNEWNRPVAKALSNLFTEDSDFIDTSTHRFHGRADIEEHVVKSLRHVLSNPKPVARPGQDPGVTCLRFPVW